MAKRLSPTALVALKEALCAFYWYKGDLRGFLQQCLSNPAILAKLNGDGYKRQIASDHVDHLVRGEFRFMLHDGSGTTEVFHEFLKRLMVGAKQPVFLIVHGYPIHKACLLRDCVEAPNGQFKLFTPLPYSPQLNPDKQVWAHVKRQLVQSRDGIKRLALDALRRIQQLPEQVKSFYRQPECRYASI